MYYTYNYLRKTFLLVDNFIVRITCCTRIGFFFSSLTKDRQLNEQLIG